MSLLLIERKKKESMEIIFKEEGEKSLLSKTQKQKLRHKIKEMWVDEETFYNQIENVLAMIHYPENCAETDKYNMIKFHYNSMTNSLILEMIHIPVETAEERTIRLRKKLQEARKRMHGGRGGGGKKSLDPRWEMYETIKNQIPIAQRNMIPNPDSIQNNLEMYRNMLTMIPTQNPLHKYISMFVPT